MSAAADRILSGEGDDYPNVSHWESDALQTDATVTVPNVTEVQTLYFLASEDAHTLEVSIETGNSIVATLYDPFDGLLAVTSNQEVVFSSVAAALGESDLIEGAEAYVIPYGVSSEVASRETSHGTFTGSQTSARAVLFGRGARGAFVGRQHR